MIRRAKQFSPHSVENDRAILETVALRLSQMGHVVTQVDEISLASCLAAGIPDFIFWPVCPSRFGFWRHRV